jgi:hypothetical protein
MLLQFHCFNVEFCHYPKSVWSVYPSRVILFIIGLRNVVAVFPPAGLLQCVETCQSRMFNPHDAA